MVRTLASRPVSFPERGHCAAGATCQTARRLHAKFSIPDERGHATSHPPDLAGQPAHSGCDPGHRSAIAPSRQKVTRYVTRHFRQCKNGVRELARLGSPTVSARQRMENIGRTAIFISARMEFTRRPVISIRARMEITRRPLISIRRRMEITRPPVFFTFRRMDIGSGRAISVRPRMENTRASPSDTGPHRKAGRMSARLAYQLSGRHQCLRPVPPLPPACAARGSASRPVRGAGLPVRWPCR